MSANIELVTSHKGTPHITTDQVRDLLAGFSGDINGIKVFQNLDDAFAYTVEDATTVRISTGQALAAGYHFQLLDAYDWLLDPGVVGYSRYDSLYLVIYEDPITLVQTADFVYQVGELYQNGTTGTVPGPPTGTNIKEEFEFMRCNSSDGAIVVVEAKYTTYLSNEQLESDVSGTVSQVQENKQALNGLRFGIDNNGKYGYYKAGADTVTPFRNPEGTAEASEVLANKTFSTAVLENAVGTMANYSGENVKKITPTGGTGVERIALLPGYYDMIDVDRTNVYNAAQNETWTDTFPMGIPAYLDCSNIKSMTVTNGQFLPEIVIFYDKNGNSAGSQTIMGYQTADLTFPSTARYVHITPDNVSAVTVVYQTKILRGK